MRLGEDRGAARSGNAVVSRRPCPVPRLTVFGRSPKPVKIEVFAKTDLGKTRDHNEDRFLVADLTRGEASLQPAVREHEVGERGSLFIVADGMGEPRSPTSCSRTAGWSDASPRVRSATRNRSSLWSRVFPRSVLAKTSILTGLGERPNTVSLGTGQGRRDTTALPDRAAPRSSPNRIPSRAHSPGSTHCR